MSCSCENVEIGSYDNQVELVLHGKRICVDRCLKDEIQHLWNLGIVTTGCCCGHNKLDGYIGVLPEHIERMKSLGYQVAPNSCRHGDEDSFYPKMRSQA